MISSKHCEKSSSRTGQMPLSRACLSMSFWSSCSLRRATSTLDACWWLTYCTYCLPFSTHSLGGRIAFRILSWLGLLSMIGPFLEPTETAETVTRFEFRNVSWVGNLLTSKLSSERLVRVKTGSDLKGTQTRVTSLGLWIVLTSIGLS